MKAVMLAAGVGRRLFGDDNDERPKALLRFNERTLLARHVSFLHGLGIDELVVVVGHRQADLEAEIANVAPKGFVRTVFNPRYEEGPIISLWAAREILRGGDDILFMDADVLYHRAMLARLINAPSPNCFLIDRDFVPGDEPVKLCLVDGEVVDFGKQVDASISDVGEWPGFMKMSPDVASRLANELDAYIERQEDQVTYELAMRDVLLAMPAGSFAVEDITGMPWIEIDFPSDLIRAEKIIYPRVTEYSDDEGLDGQVVLKG